MSIICHCYRCSPCLPREASGEDSNRGSRKYTQCASTKPLMLFTLKMERGLRTLAFRSHLEGRTSFCPPASLRSHISAGHRHPSHLSWAQTPITSQLGTDTHHISAGHRHPSHLSWAQTPITSQLGTDTHHISARHRHPSHLS